MSDQIRLTSQTVAVLRALGRDPAGWQHGYELLGDTGLKSGTLYPILMRLADRGLLITTWEKDPPLGRPRRHLYRLSADGRTVLGGLEQARPGGRAVPSMVVGVTA